MSDFSRFVPPHLRKLADAGPSRPLKQAPASARPVLLNLNENPFGPSPLALAAIRSGLAGSHRYPEIHSRDLHAEIAHFHSVEPDQVVVTAGATELLSMLARALLAPGLKAVTSERSFIVYRLATQVTGGQLVEAPMRENGYDLEAIARSVDADTRLIFIANPNNPTGSLIPADELDPFLDTVPEHALVVLDEAYGDFAQYFADRRGVRYSRSLEYLRQARQIIVLKTFSKVHGLAGLRIGYGLGPAWLIRLLRPLRTIFSVSTLAQTAAACALRDRAHIERAIENNAQQAALLTSALGRLGYKIPPTWANFLYWEVSQDAAALAERIQSHGVTVQPLALWGAPGAIRVSIGTPEENQLFLAAVEAVTGGG
jgi:histidinol-phosphate aminotransferase